jgi:hypothetical protein
MKKIDTDENLWLCSTIVQSFLKVYVLFILIRFKTVKIKIIQI